MDEGYVVTFLYWHFANGRPHNIFTVLVDLAFLPVTWIESWVSATGGCWDVSCFQGWRKSEVVMGQPAPASLPGAELSRCMASGLIVLFMARLSSDSLKAAFLGNTFSTLHPTHLYTVSRNQTKIKQKLIKRGPYDSNLDAYALILPFWCFWRIGLSVFGSYLKKFCVCIAKWVNLFIQFAMDWIVYPQSSYLEALTPNGTVFWT